MNGYLILYDGLTIELLGLNLTSHVLDQELSLYYKPESIKQTTIFNHKQGISFQTTLPISYDFCMEMHYFSFNSSQKECNL